MISFLPRPSPVALSIPSVYIRNAASRHLSLGRSDIGFARTIDYGDATINTVEGADEVAYEFDVRDGEGVTWVLERLDAEFGVEGKKRLMGRKGKGREGNGREGKGRKGKGRKEKESKKGEELDARILKVDPSGSMISV